MDNIPLWLAAVISINLGILIMIFIWLVVVPWQRRKILNDINQEHNQVNFNIGGSTGKNENMTQTSSSQE